MNTLLDWEQRLIRAIDYPLGWLLLLPRDVALIVFAVGTALLMTLARRVVTNQDLLRRCAADLRRLKQRMRGARQSHDKALLARLRSTVGMIKGMQLSADLRVLGVVVIPIAFLAIWASARFDYLPPRINQDLVIRAYYPISSVDHITHLVPVSEFELISPAIQVVRISSNAPGQGIAEWKLRPVRPTDNVTVTIRHRGETVVHHVAIGRSSYLPPRQDVKSDRVVATEVVLQKYIPVGLRVVSRYVGLPPWMIGYVMLALVLVPVLKRAFRVA